MAHPSAQLGGLDVVFGLLEDKVTCEILSAYSIGLTRCSCCSPNAGWTHSWSFNSFRVGKCQAMPSCPILAVQRLAAHIALTQCKHTENPSCCTQQWFASPNTLSLFIDVVFHQHINSFRIICALLGNTFFIRNHKGTMHPRGAIDVVLHERTFKYGHAKFNNDMVKAKELFETSCGDRFRAMWNSTTDS